MQQKRYSATDRQDFYSYFGRSLNEFWDGILGFDIVAFDDWLSIPDDISMYDFLLDNYDSDAQDLIKYLLGQ